MRSLANSRGNLTQTVLLVTVVGSIFVTSLYKTLDTNVNLRNQIGASDSSRLAINALLSYVTVSIKSQWCVGPNWTRDDCKGNELAHDGSIRRLLISDSYIENLGDYFIRNVIELKKETMDGYPSCVSNLEDKPENTQLPQWKRRWRDCIRLPMLDSVHASGITQTIDDLTDLPLNHPLANIFRSTDFQRADIGKAVLSVFILNGGLQFARGGREIILEVRINLYRKSNSSISIGTVTSRVEVLPAELNQFGLILAGDLHLDGLSLDEKGGYFPLAKDNVSWAGIHFDSPVYVDGNIILPDKTERDKSSFVRFNSNLYLSDHTLTTDAPGAICQGYTKGTCNFFNSAFDNKVNDYMNGFAQGFEHIASDEGVDYIAGPNLNGSSDSDASLGSEVQTCVDLLKSFTDFRLTNSNKMIILKDPTITNQYTLLWTNNGSSNFTQKTLTRFSTPQQNIPRGAWAQCMDGPVVENRLVRPHIYDNNRNIKVPGKRNPKDRTEIPIPLNAYALFSTNGVELTSTANSLGEDLFASSPKAFFDSDPQKIIRNALGACPNNRSQDQIDSIDIDFKEQAAAIVNVEYGITLKDTNNVQAQLKNQLNNLQNADQILLKPTLTNSDKTGIIDYLEEIFPTGGDGTLYTAKGLMGVNTKIVFQGLKDGLISALSDEFQQTSEGSFAYIAKQQIDFLEGQILSIPGLTSMVTAPVEIQTLKSEKANLVALATPTPAQVIRISELSTYIASYDSAMARLTPIRTIETTLNTIKDDLYGLNGDDHLGLGFKIEEQDDININLGYSSQQVFAPNLLKLRVNLPNQNNQFVQKFRLHIDGFDPSFVYTERADLLTEMNCEALENENGVVAIWALTATGTRKCLEIRSTRQNEAGQFPMSDFNLFRYEFDKTVLTPGGAPTITTQPSIISDSTEVAAYIDNYKTFAQKKHPGFFQYKCKILAANASVKDELNDSDPGAGRLDLSGQYNLNEGSLKTDNFANQTNHSWFITPQEGFSDVAETSYDIDSDEYQLEIASNVTGPEFPVKSIMSRCKIKNNVTFVAGFYTCRELVIEGGRNEALELAGTFIVGRLFIADSTVAQYGLHFRSIYHPLSVDRFRELGFLRSEDDCYTNLSEPIWYGKISDQNRMVLDRCEPSLFRQLAQPFTWNRVNPDCGVIKKFTDTSGDGAELTAERMACKDETTRYFVIETARGSL